MAQNIDVLIVGGGPTGLAMALDLSLQKVSFRIIDKEPVRSDKSRALVVQPRSMELLKRHGDVRELLSHAEPVHGGNFFVNRRRVASINFEGLCTDESEFRLPVNVSQAVTERFLEDCLTKRGFAVERPVSTKAFAEDADGVTVTLEHGDDASQETVRCKYVVGCDGAHSAVRHAIPSMHFDGAAYPQGFILCDAYLDGSKLPLNGLSLYLDQGVVMIFPLRDGLVRVVSMTPPSSAEEVPPTLAVFQELLERSTPAGSAGTLRDPVWVTRFHLHHRVVSTYRAGRMFVAGDAAHIHSPAGGQGMNTGMQDAFNLAWKLARALRSSDDDSDKAEALLTSYETERRPVGLALLNGTDRAFTFVAGSSRLFLALRNMLLPLVLPWVLSSPSRREAIFTFLNEFGISYQHSGSPLVETATGFAGPVRGGDRVPNGTLRRAGEDFNLLSLWVGAPFHLLLFAGAGVHADKPAATARVASRAELVAVRDQVLALGNGDIEAHFIFGADGADGADDISDPDGHVHARLGFSETPGYLLVRPDGYAAHVGPLTEAAKKQLVKFCRKWF